MKKSVLIPVLLAICLFLPACSGGYPTGDYGSSGELSESGASQSGGDSQIQPGMLTAGEWNDNKNYEFFLNLFEIGAENPEHPDESETPDSSTDPETSDVPEEPEQSNENIFYRYRDSWNMSVFHRITVDVKSGFSVCTGAKISLFEDDTLLVSAVADARGRAYLYPKSVPADTNFRLVTEYNGVQDTRSVSPDAELVTVDLAVSIVAVSTIDLCFAIDTTGSMGDELSYLKAEIDSVIERVKDSNQNVTIRLALVFYRDEGDVYVTKKYDFTTDISAQRRNLSNENASGGGDYPEAVHSAFSDALGLSWQENSSKMLFFVLDAPPHNTQPISTLYGDLVYHASQMGVRVVPVTASGTDVLTQYLMRSAAAITNGTYIFLTDDSGIGLPHDKPVVGDFVVEYLNDCLVRVINELHTGEETPPVSVFDKAQ